MCPHQRYLVKILIHLALQMHNSFQESNEKVIQQQQHSGNIKSC